MGLNELPRIPMVTMLTGPYEVAETFCHWFLRFKVGGVIASIEAGEP